MQLDLSVSLSLNQLESAVAQDSLVVHNQIEGGTAQVCLVNLNY